MQGGSELWACMMVSFCDELDDAGWSGRCARGREDDREEEGWGSPSAMKSTGDARRKAALRRGIFWRPVDVSERDQREMEEGSWGYL
jgi:hypothetical protein